MPLIGIASPTGLVTSASRPFSLFVGGVDIIAPTGSTTMLVPIESIIVSEVGFAGTSTLTVDFTEPTRVYALPAHARVMFRDNTLDETLFGGYGVGRASTASFGGAGRTTRYTAVDASFVLDKRQVIMARFPSGLSDQTIVQSLIGRYAADTFSALSTTVAQTQATMPEMTVENTDLRSALEQVAGLATTVANDGLRRRVYVDADWRLRYFSDQAWSAPFVISDAPSGAEKAPEEFEYEVDDSRIVNRVYVRGANAAGSGWLTSHNSVSLYGVREEILDAADSDSSDKRSRYGWSFLKERAYPMVRGSFQITGTTGWHAGQTVTITNAAHGLSAQTFYITQVDTSFLTGAGTRTNVVNFGERPKRRLNRLHQFHGLRPNPSRTPVTPVVQRPNPYQTPVTPLTKAPGTRIG